MSFPSVYTGNLVAGLSFQMHAGSITFACSKGPYSTPSFIFDDIVDYGNNTEGADDLERLFISAGRLSDINSSQVRFQTVTINSRRWVATLRTTGAIVSP